MGEVFKKQQRKEKNKMATTIRIANSVIELGAKYTLDNRPDPSAPDGLKEMTKYPFQGNETKQRVSFSDITKLHDTGFYVHSPCLKIMKEAEREEAVKNYIKYIKTPFEKQRNADLNEKENNPFWDDFFITAYVNRQFDTNNISELLELFYILNLGMACEADERDPFVRKDAQFLISSPSKVKGKAKENTNKRKSAYLKFNTILNGDRDKLDLVLQWIGKENPSKVDSDDLDATFYQIINDKNEGLKFCEQFTTALDEYETPVGKEKMEWFFGIRRLLNLRKIKQKSGRYVTADHQETFLGNTLQDVSAFCLNDKSAQYTAIKELLEQNPETKRPEHIKPKKT